MSKFWQKKYISKYTGAEIDAAVAKADAVPDVTSADAGKALVVDDDGKIVTGAIGIDNGTVVIDITSATAGTINSVKFNDVEKGSAWLKDPKTAAILSISQTVVKINDDNYALNGNWVNSNTLLSGNGAYTHDTPDGLEFGLFEINFVFADDEINAFFDQLLST